MRVERFRYFEAAARLGSLRRAAQELGISQPTLSTQIQALEEELDLVLLARNAQGVTSTAAGEALLDCTRTLITAEDALKDQALGISGLRRGTVRIGCVTVALRGLLASVIEHLIQDHPGLSFSVVEGPSAAIEQMTAAGHLDLALVVTASNADDSQTLLHTKLVDVGVVACLPHDHPLAGRESVLAQELHRWPLVVMPEGTMLRTVLLSGRPAENIIFEASTIDTARLMISRGVGVGVDTTLGVSTIPPGREQTIAYVPVEGPRATLSLALIRARRGQPSKAVLLVSRLIRDQASQSISPHQILPTHT